MIFREELLAQAAVADLNEADVQRDYLFGWLISGLFTQSGLRDGIVLKGGNALRKAYFPGTRFSDDLDLTTERGLDANQLLAELNGVCEYVQAAAGVEFEFDRNRILNEQTIEGNKRVYKISALLPRFHRK